MPDFTHREPELPPSGGESRLKMVKPEIVIPPITVESVVDLFTSDTSKELAERHVHALGN